MKERLGRTFVAGKLTRQIFDYLESRGLTAIRYSGGKFDIFDLGDFNGKLSEQDAERLRRKNNLTVSVYELEVVA